jgi:hypothetical protein
MTQLLCSQSGIKITLGRLLKTGGEGKIYESDHPDGLVAKVYHSLDGLRLKKLEVMLANPPDDQALFTHGQVTIAWPSDLLRDSHKKWVGFVMPRIEQSESLFTACNPEQRTRQMPDFTWLSLHRVARDMALLLHSLHSQNYVVGDVNPKNFLVCTHEPSPFLVAVIDSDSFQVSDPASGQVYTCTVEFPGYTPPELLKKEAVFQKLGEAQDRFGLALLVYSLLFGHHPFEGKWTLPGNPPDTNMAVQQGWWVYAANSPIEPPPVTIPLSALHPELCRCFQRAFNEGQRNPALRPSAQEWKNALEAAMANLTWCGIQEPRHYYEPAYGQCCWCQLKNQPYEGGGKADPFAARAEVHSETLNQLREFEQALMNQDERKMLTLWQQHPFLAHHAPLRKHQKNIEASVPVLQLLEQFIQRYRQNPADEQGLCQFWQSHPCLALCRAAQFEKLDNLPISYVAQNLQRRVEVLHRLEQAISYPLAPDFLLHEEGEKNIVSTYQLYQGAVLQNAHPFACIITRVEEARKRLASWQQLSSELKEEEDKIVEAWEGSGGLLEKFAPVQPYIPLIKEARKKVACLEIFVNLAQQAESDEEKLWNLWLCDQLLPNCRLARQPTPRLGGMTPAARAELAHNRSKALQCMQQALLLQEQHGRSLGVLGEAEERELAECGRNYAALCKGSAFFRKRYKDRLDAAQQRMASWELLQKGIATHDTEIIAEAWGDGSLLVNFAPTKAYREAAETAVRQMRVLREFIASWQTNSEDEDTLAAIWQKEPGLSQCTAARRPNALMQGLVPADRAALAAKRLAILQSLRAIVACTPLDDFALLQTWDDAICRGHTAFRSFVPLLYKARERIAKWQSLSELVERGDDAGICALWDEAIFSGMARVIPLLARIRLAMRRHYLTELAVRPLTLPGLRRQGNTLYIGWEWSNPKLVLCTVAARHDRFPATPEDVEEARHSVVMTRDLYLQQHGAYLPLAAPAYVCVWPTLLFAGQLLFAEDPLKMQETLRSSVHYRVCRPLWQKPYVWLVSDSDLSLPPLVVTGVCGRLPVWGDDEAKVIAELPAARLARKKLLHMPLPKLDNCSGNLVLRLWPRDVENFSWLDLEFVVH